MTNIVSCPKKYLFKKISLDKHFFWTNFSLSPQTKKKSFLGSYIWKLKAAAFQNTLELYNDQIIWGRNYCVNIDNAVLLPPINALLAQFLDIKTLFAMKKENNHSKWLTPWERYDWDNFFSLVFGCQYKLFLALDFFQHSCHHMVPIYCKALFAMAKIQSSGHDHQAPFWLVVVVVLVLLLGYQAVTWGKNKLPNGQYMLDP